MADGKNIGFRTAIRRILPPWLRDRVTIQKTTGYRLLASYACLLDAAMQVAIEGLQSTLPRFGTPTALPFHGRDRRIFRGPNQTHADYAAQLTEWLLYWREAGNAWSLTRNLQKYLSPGNPKIRVVTRNGFWTTLLPDGSLEFHRNSAWNWDSVTHPGNSGKWWHIWVIVYEPHLSTAGTWGIDADKWGQEKAFGNETSKANVEMIKTLIQQWKGAHAHVVSLIWTYDATKFDPTVNASFPTDGLWGFWHKIVSNQGIESRFANARYWEIN